MSESVAELAQKIINGHRIKRGDDLSIFLDADLEELERGAGAIQKRFRRNHVDLCSIINGRSGRCPEDCKYCAQSAHNHTGIDEYGFLPKEEIYAAAKKNQEAGLNRFAIVTAGRALTGKEFDEAIAAFKMMKKDLTIELCASMGFLTQEQFHRLHEAGVTSYHHNIETSKRFFPHICTTHTYEDKIRTIKIAQKEGFCVCSGGIIGMGENWDDRLDMAISLAELGIESIHQSRSKYPSRCWPQSSPRQWRESVPLRRVGLHQRRHADDERHDDKRRPRDARPPRTREQRRKRLGR